MAKKTRKGKQAAPSGCCCSAGLVIVAAVVLALGLFALVWGISTQWTGGPSTAGFVILLYIVGLLLLGVGKLIKHDSCRTCPAHGWK